MEFFGIEMSGPMILQKLELLPDFNIDTDVGRYVYISSEMGGVVYYGAQTEWRRLLIIDDIGTAIDEVNNHVNDFLNPHNVTLTQLGGTPLTSHNSHVNNKNDPHNTIHLIQTQLVPPGAVFHFARSTAPSGYLICNGSIVSRSTYANLFDAIGTRFGSGNESTTFGLPNLLGEFIRGWDGGRGVDSGRVFGSFQSDAIRNIIGTSDIGYGTYTSRFRGGSGSGALGITKGGSGAWVDESGPAYNDATIGVDFNAARVVPTAADNRPRNIALLPCIKV